MCLCLCLCVCLKSIGAPCRLTVSEFHARPHSSAIAFPNPNPLPRLHPLPTLSTPATTPTTDRPLRDRATEAPPRRDPPAGSKTIWTVWMKGGGRREVREIIRCRRFKAEVATDKLPTPAITTRQNYTHTHTHTHTRTHTHTHARTHAHQAMGRHLAKASRGNGESSRAPPYLGELAGGRFAVVITATVVVVVIAVAIATIAAIVGAGSHSNDTTRGGCTLALGRRIPNQGRVAKRTTKKTNRIPSLSGTHPLRKTAKQPRQTDLRRPPRAAANATAAPMPTATAALVDGASHVGSRYQAAAARPVSGTATSGDTIRRGVSPSRKATTKTIDATTAGVTSGTTALET